MKLNPIEPVDPDGPSAEDLADAAQIEDVIEIYEDLLKSTEEADPDDTETIKYYTDMIANLKADAAWLRGEEEDEEDVDED